MVSQGMMPLQCFVKTDTNIQVALWFCLRNLRGCNVDVTDVTDL
jgi:hypothetical protein